MPRKQNAFGNPKSFAFKPSKGVNKSKGQGAAGYYPSNRQYGSSVQRTVIEHYDLDSNWVKWRKGYEYYARAALSELETLDPITQEYSPLLLNSVLYQGTAYPVNVQFTGYKYATLGSDSNNHYVMKRETTSDVDLGKVSSVFNDVIKYPIAKANREILVQIAAGVDSRLLLQMIGERITDGETEASLNYILNDKLHPALYIGKTPKDEPTTITATLNADTLSKDIQQYVGKIIYIKDFYKESPLNTLDQANRIEFIDDSYTFKVKVEDDLGVTDVIILDPEDETLPPALYDIANLEKLAETTSTEVIIKGTYQYDKSLYQKFFGKQYLSADLVKSEIESISYTVLPFTIRGIQKTPGANTVDIIALPFNGEFKMYTNVNDGRLSFADWSFTKTSLDTYDGEYYHQFNPETSQWLRIDTDIDPWMDEIFTSGQPLKPAKVYTCSCPNHAQAILRAPQETESAGTRKINRQRRYPLPTALGQKDLTGEGLQAAAGRIESWESREHRMSFKMCKHSIAAMFLDRIKVQEPSTYPTIDSREKFEEKLKVEMAGVGARFQGAYTRGGITTIELIFALGQGLNLDDVELAYIILNTNF